MKTAIELAMEKLDKDNSSETIIPLTNLQKEQIQEIRREYKAKIAERDVMLQSEINKVSGAESPDIQDFIDVKREEFAHEKNRLESEMEAKIEKVRQKR